MLEVVDFEWLLFEADEIRNLVNAIDVQLFAERREKRISAQKMSIFGMKNATAS